MGTLAIIPAAGAGVRMGSDRAKQFLEINGRPIIALTLEKFEECPAIEGIILVVPEDEVDFCKKDIIEKYGFRKVIRVIKGGLRRQDSVRLGIEASGGDYERILIHDGVRPFIEKDLIDRALAAAKDHRAVIAAMPVKETVKEVDPEENVTNTLDRQRLRLVQTPQVFRYEDISKAHKLAVEEGWEEATDDALLVERIGITVKVIEGAERNIKITTPGDLKFAGILGYPEKGVMT